MKKNYKKIAGFLGLAVLTATLATGCGAKTGGTSATATGDKAAFNQGSDITVLSREEGSGTRGAFVELFGIEKKDADGKKVDYTTQTAAYTNSTSVMMTSVANDTYGIGYISLGSLNDTVKVLKIDGAAPSVENVKNSSYKIVRPFNIVSVEDKLSESAKDFKNYIMSTEGQKIISDNGYIAVKDSGSFKTADTSEKVVVGGSSSVSPVMEKLIEAYKKVNSKANIELQTTDSTTGVSNTLEGVYNIGMASRELKDSETAKGVTETTIAQDGIAVIVNKDNPVDELSTDDVMKIYTGDITTWEGYAK